MIFVDTSAWFAIFVSNDFYSFSAKKWLKENRRETLITTDFVIDELLTLLRQRNEPERAIVAGERFLTGTLANVEFVSEQDFHNAWDVFRVYRDKQWSFTDCTSRVVMERLGIQSAFAFDNHFRQFGSISVFPRE